MVRSISTASRAGHPRSALVFQHIFYILVLRQLFPKSSPATPALCSQGSRRDSWDGALCVSSHRIPTWLSPHRSPHSTNPAELWLWDTTRESSKICHPEQQQPQRCTRYLLTKNSVFPQVFVLPIMEQVEPRNEVHTHGCPASCFNSLPGWFLLPHRWRAAHSSRKTRIKNRTVHNFQDTFSSCGLTSRSLCFHVFKCQYCSSGKVSQALIHENLNGAGR